MPAAIVTGWSSFQAKNTWTFRSALTLVQELTSAPSNLNGELSTRDPKTRRKTSQLTPHLCYRIPPNCRFEIDDFELDWSYIYPFDFIHARSIEGSVKDYRRLFQQARENLTPGGWIEVAEPTVGVFCDDDTIELAPNLLEWRDRLIEASHLFGKPMGVAKHYKEWLVEAGFVNVKEDVYKVCLAPIYELLIPFEKAEMDERGLTAVSRYPIRPGRKIGN